jgi:hypothetical protein
MSVDSTDLLNKRHFHDNLKDEKWLTTYPVDPEDELTFDDIIVYEKQRDSDRYKGTYITINNTSITSSLHTYYTLITSTTCPVYPDDELNFNDIIVYEKQRDCDSYKGTYITL